MKNFKLTIAITLGILLFLSCENAEKKDIKNKVDTTTSYNPYDQVGIIHNHGLTFVLSNYAKVSSKLKASNDVLIINCLTSKFMEREVATSNNKRTYESSLGFLDAVTAKQKTTLKNGVPNFENLTSKQEYFIKKFTSILKEESTNSKNVLQKISIIEKEIIESNITAEEQSIPLLFAAVGKNSLQYWESFIEKNKIKPSNLKGSRINWKEVVISDATGAVLGGVRAGYYAGRTGAIVFGPQGIVLSAAAGAILGAISGSAGGALDSWIGSWIKYGKVIDKDSEIKYPDGFPDELKNLTQEEFAELITGLQIPEHKPRP